MPDRHFRMRLHCDYAQPDNAIAVLQVEQMVEGQWRVFALNHLSPGFDIYTYALLSCQHTYFRLNCAERGLQLAGVDGELSLVGDADWQLQKMQVRFDARLLAGQPDADTLDYIRERMTLCPVSKNTRPIADNEVLLNFS
jgi:hypothetical protein